MDALWLKIVVGVDVGAQILDHIFAPVNALGPVVAIAVIALVTLLIAKGLSRVYTTRRYEELRREFQHWFSIREEALKSDDPEKGKLLAKNIDKDRLNKVYYDYFFEGLLKNLITTYLPVFLMLAYVNEAYKPANLLSNFGREYIFKLGEQNGEPILIGSVFWFVVILFAGYLMLGAARHVIARRRAV